MRDCCFCAENFRFREADASGAFEIPSRILFENENWYLVPTLGCFTTGYVLLISKKHVFSVANLDCDSFREMLAIKARVEEFLAEHCGMKCLCFEHGVTSDSCDGPNSVNHLHLHIAPFHRPIWRDMALDGFQSVARYEDLLSIWAADLPDAYLIFQDVDGKIYYHGNASGFPSQFFRMRIAPYYGASEWNWKRNDYGDNILNSIALFKSFK